MNVDCIVEVMDARTHPCCPPSRRASHLCHIHPDVKSELCECDAVSCPQCPAGARVLCIFWKLSNLRFCCASFRCTTSIAFQHDTLVLSSPIPSYHSFIFHLSALIPRERRPPAGYALCTVLCSIIVQWRVKSNCSASSRLISQSFLISTPLWRCAL